jgi:tight adherence protein B
MLVGFGLFFLTFVIAIAAVLCASALLEAVRRARGRQAPPDEEEEDIASSTPLLRDDQLSSISVWASVLEQLDIADRIQDDLSRASLSWSVGRVTLLMLLCGAAAAAMASGQSWIPGWAVAVLSLGAGVLPWMYVRRRAAKRLRQFEERFPDALESMARVMRVGHPFAAALEAVGLEAEEPVASEILRLSTEGNLATSWSDALNSFASRVPLLEVDMFVAAVQLHLRTGGKLSQLVEQIAESMRENVALRGEIRACAAHGKMTGLILTALPVGIAAIMVFVNPSYMAVLVAHPWGKTMIAAAVACLVLAHLVIRKMVDIKV